MARKLRLCAGTYSAVTRPIRVRAALRLAEAGLRLEEVPADMRNRATGASKLRGSQALKLVLSVGATLVLGRRVLRLVRGATGPRT